MNSFSGAWAPQHHACVIARQCHEEVQALIESDFSPAACQIFFREANRLPAGAQEMRETADRSVAGALSRCLEPINSIRYICTAGSCLPQSYLYCGRWSYSLVDDDPRYGLAHELAHLIDFLHDRTQQLCGSVLTGRGDRAELEASFKGWASGTLLPVTERLENLACGYAKE